MFVSECDGSIVEGEDARVGDGDAEDVAGEILEDGVLTLAPAGDFDDPGFGPDEGDDEVGAFVGEQSLELAANELGQGYFGDEKGLASGVPMAAVGGDTAAGNEAVNVGMVAPTPTIP